MKTKTLVSAMALPLLLAACSQEEFVSQSNNQGLDGRKVVGNVTFNLEMPETRMVIEGGRYQWVGGDQFGACLMDEFMDNGVNWGEAGWWDQFNVKDYIQTNYPFTRGEGENASWSSEAVMQEGNYFFYFPYNSNLGGKRTPIRLEVPTEQTIDVNNPYGVLSKQLFVAYSPVYAEEGKTKESVNIRMEPLLAFPGFGLKNVGTGSLNITRIAFVADGGFSKVMEVVPATGSFSGATYLAQDEATQRETLKGIVRADDEEKADKINLSFGENGYQLGSQSTVNALMLIPEGTYKNPKLYIYSNYGLAIADLNEPHRDGGSTPGATNITNNRALTNIAYNDGAYVEITFDNTSFAQPDEMVVSSTEDLEDLLQWSANTTDASQDFTANVQGDNVQISKKVCDMLAANPRLNLVVTSNDANAPVTITIPAEASVNTLDRITFDNVKVVNKAALSVHDDFGYNSTDQEGIIELTNESGASITLTGNNYGLTNTIVVNKGTLTFAHDMTVNAGNYPAAGGEGRIENAKDATMVIASDLNVASGGLINNGQLTINSGVEVTARIVNNATLNLNGTWNTKFAAGVNNGTITVAAGAELKVDTENTNNKYVNEGTVNNSGAVYNLTNNDLVNQVTAGASYIGAAGGNGRVDNTVCSQQTVAADSEDIIVTVTEAADAKDLNTLLKRAQAEIVVFNNATGLTLDAADVNANNVFEFEIPSIEINGDFTITTPEDMTLNFQRGEDKAGSTDLTVNSGRTVISALSNVTMGTKNYGAKIKVNAGAELVVQNNATLGADANINFSGDGKLSNYGTINNWNPSSTLDWSGNQPNKKK